MRNTIISLPQHAHTNPTGTDPDWDLGMENQHWLQHSFLTGAGRIGGVW